MIPAEAQTPAADLVERLKPSVALIRAGNACGSAFVVDSSGILITALHILSGVRRTITAQLPGGLPQPADVLAVSVKNDVALLKVAQQGLMPVPLADGSDVKVWQQVMVVGYPLCTASGPAFLRRRINAVKRPSSGGAVDTFQLDMAMTHGENGGPIVTMAGQVIGVADQDRPDPAPSGASLLAVDQPSPIGISVEAVKGLVESGKSHPALALPLDTVIKRVVTFKGSASGLGATRTDVACVTPPDGARTLSRVHGELRASSVLNIVAWLSAQGNQGERVATLSPDAATIDADLQAPPVAVCLSFEAKSTMGGMGIMIPFGFDIAYTLEYEVWSSEVLSTQL